MSRRLILPLLVLSVLSQSSSAAETLYISSQKAKIYQEASFKSRLLASLKRNAEVDLLENKGIWMQVSNARVTGWVSRYAVTSNKPFKIKVSIFTRLKNFFTNSNKRERLTLVSTAGGVRGLSARENDVSGRRDFEAVAHMEKLALDEAEIDLFIQGNKN